MVGQIFCLTFVRIGWYGQKNKSLYFYIKILWMSNIFNQLFSGYKNCRKDMIQNILSWLKLYIIYDLGNPIALNIIRCKQAACWIFVEHTGIFRTQTLINQINMIYCSGSIHSTICLLFPIIIALMFSFHVIVFRVTFEILYFHVLIVT